MDKTTSTQDHLGVSTSEPPVTTKRGRGRPKVLVITGAAQIVSGMDKTISTQDHLGVSPSEPPVITKRGRGRPKVLAITEEPQFVSELEKIRTSHNPKVGKVQHSRKRKGAGNPPTDAVWSLEEKQRFVTGLSKGGPFRKTDGTVNWQVLTKFVQTKSLKEVKEFARIFNALENGNVYEEFSTKAAVDVWRQLADNLTMPGDNIANVCIPQVLTVAALEPVQNKETLINQPNYSNIYNYLSSVTRGTEVPDLPAADAAVVLELLEDLIKWLSKSQTLIQREFMHARYAELCKHLTQSDDENLNKQYYTSTNPFAIPFDILEFKGESFSNEATNDVEN